MCLRKLGACPAWIWVYTKRNHDGFQQPDLRAGAFRTLPPRYSVGREVLLLDHNSPDEENDQLETSFMNAQALLV